MTRWASGHGPAESGVAPKLKCTQCNGVQFTLRVCFGDQQRAQCNFDSIDSTHAYMAGVCDYSYNATNQVTSIDYWGRGVTGYGYDNGNRGWMTDNDGLTDYVYDASGSHWARLDAVTYPAISGGPPAATIDYSMDDVGNRTGDGSTTHSAHHPGRSAQ